MRKILTAVLFAYLVATQGAALTVRPLTGRIITPDGTAVSAGNVVITPQGRVPTDVTDGGLAQLTTGTYPIVSGNLTCSGPCTIVSPATYRFQVYQTVLAVDRLVWTFQAGVPEASGTISLQEIYSAGAQPTINPSYMLVGGDVAQLGSGTAYLHQVLSANGTGGFVWFNVAGTGTVTDVLAGTGLSGGGSGGALTLSLANTAVSPGSYGLGLGKAGGFTVDAQGRLTGASERGLGLSDVSGLGAALALLAPITSPTFTGTVTGTFSGDLMGNVTGDITGNAGTVTAGVYTTGNYSNPAWITSLAGSKLTGSVPASDDGLSSATGTAPLVLSLTAKALNGSLAVTPTNDGGAVALQASTPGTQQTGNLNLSGTARAATFVGNLVGDVTGNVTTSGDGLTSAGGTAPLTLNLATKALVGSIAITAANDGGAVALQGTTPGTTQTGNLNLSGVIKAGSFVGDTTGNLTGNASTVTNGVYTTGSYPDPSWLTSIAGSKVIGDIAGNAATVTNGVYTTGGYPDPSWIVSLDGSKITGTIAANATTASALAIAPTQCGASYFSTGIAANGNANCSQPAFSDISGTATWSQVLKSGSDAIDLGSGGAANGYVLTANGAGTTSWTLITGTYTPPAGTGFVHISGGAEDANAKLVSNVDVDAAAGILWSKINPTGALPSEVGAAPIAEGIQSASGTAPLVLAFSANALTGSVNDATASTLGTIQLSGDLGGAATSVTVLAVGGSLAADLHSAELAANAATDANTASRIVMRDASGDFSAGIITADLIGSVTDFSGSLNGDVTGTQAATVVTTVGGSAAADVNTGVVAANAATATNTASTIVKRDSNGDFAAHTITAGLVGNVTGNLIGNITGNITGDVMGNAGTVTNGVYTSRQINAGAGLSGGGSLASDVTLSLASPVEVANGGMGADLSTGGVVGDLIIADSGSTFARLPKGTEYQVLSGGPVNPTWGPVALAESSAVNGSLPITNGGTGQSDKTAGFDALSPFSALGDILYGGASGTGTTLPGNTTTTKMFLTQTGDGANSVAPGWEELTAALIPDLDAAKITTGSFSLAVGGTGSDLSATGAGYVKQANLGDPLTVGAIGAYDYPAMIGDGGSGGTQGAVPDPGVGDAAAGKFLSAAGTWLVPATQPPNSGDLTATYITQVPDVALVNSQALSDLGGAGILKVAATTGVISIASVGSDYAAGTHDHDASAIVTGLLALDRGGTATDLSGTGGTGQFLRQSTTGGAIAVSTIGSSDLPAATASVAGIVTLTGDLGNTYTSPTVVTVGGSTAANIHGAEVIANTATNSNVASSVVRRDASGNFSAGTITASLNGNAATASNGLNSAAGTAPLTLSLLSGALTGSLAVTATNSGGTVALQASSPGTAQTGNLNISGTLTAGALSATSWKLVTSPGSGNYSGRVLAAQQAGENLPQKSVAYLAADGKWYLAKADAVGTSGPVLLGMVPTTIAGAAMGVIVIDGVVEVGAWGLTVGSVYFVDYGTAGNMLPNASFLPTVGNQIRAVGHALSATAFYFCPSVDWGEKS